MNTGLWSRTRQLTDPLELEDFLLLAAVLLLPWAFGGVEMWAYRGASLLIVAAAGVALWREGWGGLGLDRRARWLLPALLLPLWGAIQIVPLPPGVVELLSPTADALYRETFPGYPAQAAPDVLGAIERNALGWVPEADEVPLPVRESLGFDSQPGGRWSGFRSLSLLPSAGVERLHWYGALLLAFLLARRRCADEEIAQQYRSALFAMFVGLAVFGLIFEATSNGMLYWIRPVSVQVHPFGPYVNPNNFGAVMELAAPWLAGCALASMARAGSMALPLRRTPIFAVGTLLCCVAGLASASKATAVLLAVSLTLLALLATRGLGRRLTVVAASALLVVVAVVTLSQTRLGERIQVFLDRAGGGYAEADRVVAWSAAWGMIRDYPVTGAGFGAFRDVFPAYMPAGELARWRQLHNDYLEVVAEGGVIAALLVVWLIWAYWRRVLRPHFWRSELETAGLILGVATLSVHALWDFNHQVPANALLFVTLAAIAVARCERPASGSKEES